MLEFHRFEDQPKVTIHTPSEKEAGILVHDGFPLFSRAGHRYARALKPRTFRANNGLWMLENYDDLTPFSDRLMQKSLEAYEAGSKRESDRIRAVAGQILDFLTESELPALPDGYVPPDPDFIDFSRGFEQ